jgi:chromosome segregation ATPase
MKIEKNIYLRNDGRYEARYISGKDNKGHTRYKAVYANTLEAVKERLCEVLRRTEESPEISDNAMGKQAFLGGVNFSEDEAKKLKSLAKKAVRKDNRIAEYKRKIEEKDSQINDLNADINDLQRIHGMTVLESQAHKRNYDNLYSEVKPFLEGIRKSPEPLMEFMQNQQKSKTREGER